MTMIQPAVVVAAAAAAAVGSLLFLRSSKSIRRQQDKEASFCHHDGDKCILVTGCDSGFGREVALRALQAGFHVVAACYTEEGARFLEDHDHQSSSSSISTVVADLTTKEGRQRVVEATKRVAAEYTNNELYALINNAGLCIPGNVEWLPPDAYERTMNLNFHAPVQLVYEMLPLLKRRGRGSRVINVTSVDGFIALPMNAAYNASKHALEAFSDTLRCEMLPFGVKVVVIQPATMRTPLAMSFADGWFKTFQQAPKERREPYGDEWADHMHKSLLAGLENFAVDPAPTVQALLQVLQLKDPPTRMVIGNVGRVLWKPLSRLPDKIRDKVLYALTFSVVPIKPTSLQFTERPRPGRVSHITIQVSNLERALPFYQTIGFTLIQSKDGHAFLKCGTYKGWRPLILLQEKKKEDMGQRTSVCHDIGMTRLAVYTNDVKREMTRLEQEGLFPKYPLAVDAAGKIAAYEDPDGFVICFVELNGFHGGLFRFYLFLKGLQAPFPFSLTINVTSAKEAFVAFKGMGFNKLFEQSRDQIAEGMLPAFGLEAKNTLIERIYYKRLPSCNFVACVIEWVIKPKSEEKASELMHSLSISVEDAEEALENARMAGMEVESSVVKQRLPVFGDAIKVCSAHVETGNSHRIEFIEFCSQE